MSAALLGFDVIESKNVPEGQMFVLPDRRLLVRSFWAVQFALLLGDQVRLWRADLAAIVAAAELRLFGPVVSGDTPNKTEADE